MARQVRQVRYTASSNSQNNAVANSLITGSAFDSYTPIVQLGVQALPGTAFSINNSQTPVVVGSTGIYELDIDGLATITKLQFSKSSIERLPVGETIIVDFIYDREA